MTSNYCSAVDAGLFVSTDGAVGLCCSGAEQLGSTRRETVQEIFKKSRVIELRNNLKSGRADSYCSGCDNIEKLAAGSSQRSAFNDQFKPQTERHIRLADIRWSNVCNLTCRYCNTHDSSEWRKLHNLPIETVNRDYTESLFEEITASKDTLECLYLLGGEPLMQKHNERLLDLVNPTVKIDLLSNLSVGLENNKIYQKLKSFPNVYWNLSFDNVGNRFEYVRQGAKWDVFTDNVKRLCDDFGNSHVTFHPVYTIWNATNLAEFYDYAATGDFRVNWQLALPKMDTHGYQSDGFIVYGHKTSIIDRAIQEIDRLNISDPVLQNIRTSLSSDAVVQGKDKKFLDWTARMEQFMPPNKPFAELWPELNTLLDLP
jgi:organic radical activating enzyme